MAQHVAGQLADVGGQGVVAAAQERERLGAEHHVDRRPRAGPERHVPGEVGRADRGRVAGRGAQPHGVLDDLRVDVHRVRAALVPEQGLDVDHRFRRLVRGGHPLDDDVLLRRRGVADQHLEHEPVELGLRQRVGALRLDRVLRRHHQERVRRRVGVAPDRHLPLLHDLQQRALHLRRAPG